MKALLLMIVAASLTLGLVSCQKEQEVKPSVEKVQNTVVGGEKGDLGGWD